MRFYCYPLILNCYLTLSAADGPKPFNITEPIDHAESPSWDNRTGILYYVNIHEGGIYRYVYETRDLKHINLNGEVAPVIQSKADPNLLIVGLNLSVAAVQWDGESAPSPARILTTFTQQDPTSRVNEGKADKQGRLWIGTMGYENASGLVPNDGKLYKVSCDNLTSPEVEIAPVNISNGLAWNAANTKFYYIDTPTLTVAEYDYDDATATIANPRVVFDVNDHKELSGSPDGMTIDKDDNLWIALWGGWAVVKVNPSTKKLLQVVDIPAEYVTSAMWGGPNFDVLFVTTSRYTLTEEQRQEQPQAGAVFEIRGLGTKGVPVFEVNLLQSIEDEGCGRVM